MGTASPSEAGQFWGILNSDRPSAVARLLDFVAYEYPLCYGLKMGLSTLNIGWFSTGRGPGSRGLLSFVQERLARREIDARIQFVFSNREEGEAEGSDEFLALVNGYGLPLETLSSARFRRARGETFSSLRAEFDRLVADRLASFRPDVCVLAGYMLILGGEMCRQYPFLNLHPALPNGPVGTWQQVVWELIESRAVRTGTMIHLATEALDRGPVVSYCTVSLSTQEFAPHWSNLVDQGVARVKEMNGEDSPLFRCIRRVQYSQEPYLLFETLGAVADGRVSLEALMAQGPGQAAGEYERFRGLCLDDKVAEAMASDKLADSA